MDRRELVAGFVAVALLSLSLRPFDAAPHAGLDDPVWYLLVTVAVGYWMIYLRWIRTV